MVGKTPESIIAVRPLKDGVIADFDTVEMMLHYFIRKVHMQRMMAPHPRVVIGIPSGVTEVEKRAAKDAALSAGAREAYTIEEPMAAAIGAGLPINEPVGSMIVDIGGGTTEVAVISLGGIVVNHSIRVAGDEIDDAIIQYARRDHNLVIGERTAENAKIAAGSAYPLEEEIRVMLRGRDLLTGLPKASRSARSSCAMRSRRRSTPSSSWSKPRSKRPRRSWSPTSWSRGSRWPEAARCCMGSIAGSRTS